jgi:hypothetical protein
MDFGYTHLHRKIWKNPVLQEKNKRFSRLEAWLYLNNALAQGMDRNGLKRGEFKASYRYLAGIWNWSIDAVYRFMMILEREKMIAHPEREPERKAEHFIICNYELYNPAPNAKPNANPNNIKEREIKNKEKDTRQPGPADMSVLFEIYESENHKLPQVQERTPERVRKCQSRINQARRKGCLEQYLSEFRAAVERAQRTPFLCGETGGWRANFDWFVANNTNVYGVLEGKYDSWKKKERSYTPDRVGESNTDEAETASIRQKYAEFIRDRPPERRTLDEIKFIEWYESEEGNKYCA